MWAADIKKNINVPKALLASLICLRLVQFGLVTGEVVENTC